MENAICIKRVKGEGTPHLGGQGGGEMAVMSGLARSVLNDRLGGVMPRRGLPAPVLRSGLQGEVGA